MRVVPRIIKISVPEYSNVFRDVLSYKQSQTVFGT